MSQPQMRVMLQIEYGNGMARSMVNLGAAETAPPAMIGFALGQQIESLRALAIERGTKHVIQIGGDSGMTSDHSRE